MSVSINGDVNALHDADVIEREKVILPTVGGKLSVFARSFFNTNYWLLYSISVVAAIVGIVLASITLHKAQTTENACLLALAVFALVKEMHGMLQYRRQNGPQPYTMANF